MQVTGFESRICVLFLPFSFVSQLQGHSHERQTTLHNLHASCIRLVRGRVLHGTFSTHAEKRSMAHIKVLMKTVPTVRLSVFYLGQIKSYGAIYSQCSSKRITKKCGNDFQREQRGLSRRAYPMELPLPYLLVKAVHVWQIPCQHCGEIFDELAEGVVDR